MSYEKTEWKKGMKITSALLNKMEEGIADAGGGVMLAELVSATLGSSSTTDLPEGMCSAQADLSSAQYAAIAGATGALYLFDADHPLTKEPLDGDFVLLWNMTFSEGQPALVPGATTGYCVFVAAEQSAGVLIVVSTEDVGNETVTILEAKASGSSNELLVTADLAIDGSGNPTLSNLSATIDEIGEANVAGKPVRLHASSGSVDRIAFDGYLGLFFEDGPFAVFTSGAMSGETPSIVFAIISEQEPSVFFIELGGNAGNGAPYTLDLSGNDSPATYSDGTYTISDAATSNTIWHAITSGKPAWIQYAEDGVTKTSLVNAFYVDESGSDDVFCACFGADLVLELESFEDSSGGSGTQPVHDSLTVIMPGNS